MPKLSETMEEGTILTWLKHDGDAIEAGEDLVEIETDKATVTHQAEASGVLSIVAAEGASLQVGSTIARLWPRDEQSATEAPVAAPEPLAVIARVGVSHESEAASSVESVGRAAAPLSGNGDRLSAPVKATPLARRIARVHAVALEEVQGSGPLGRITRRDVLRKAGIAYERSALPARSERAMEETAAMPVANEPTPTGGAKGEVVVVAPTRLQTVVARRMAEAKATIPHFQVQTDVRMEAAIDFRAQLTRSAIEAIPSFNDLIVKAAALALRAHPLANGAYREGRFELYQRINIGIAVAADNALVVPTIIDADAKSLDVVAAEARRLAESVRDGSVSPRELSGATFTVSNLGMYGMTAITPVINGAQAAILGVGAVRDVLARVDGEIVDRHLMTLTLSCDHRILYGAQAADFLSTIRELLEHPLKLVLRPRPTSSSA